MKVKRIISVIFAAAFALIFAVSSSASLYDCVSGGKYKEITGDPFVADTFYGVDALYSTKSKVYQCNELVNRFYKQAYGMNIFAGGQFGVLSYSDNYTFVKLTKNDTPKAGDIIYASAENRNGSGVHWALVKSYSSGVITMFEQNVVWSGKAGIDRKLKWPPGENDYVIYTPVGKNGHSDPVLKQANIDSETTAATNFTYPKEVLATANGSTTTAPSTTKPTTEKTTTTTTVKPTATTKPTTTAKPTTTVPETTAPAKTEAASEKTEVTSSAKASSATPTASTTAVKTTKKVTATAVTSKALTSSTTAPSSFSEASTEISTEAFSTVIQTRVYEESEEYISSAESAEEENAINKPKTVLIAAVAVTACLVCGAAAILIKKKSK